MYNLRSRFLTVIVAEETHIFLLIVGGVISVMGILMMCLCHSPAVKQRYRSRNHTFFSPK